MSDIEYIHCPFLFYESWTRQDLKVFLKNIPNRSDTAIVLAYPTEPATLKNLQPEIDRFLSLTRKLQRQNKILLLLDHCSQKGEIEGIDQIYYTHWFAIDAVVRMKCGLEINTTYNTDSKKGLLLPGYLNRDHRLGLLSILEYNHLLDDDKTVWSFYPSPYDDLDSMNKIWNKFFDGSESYIDFRDKYGVRILDKVIAQKISNRRQEPMIGGPGYSFPCKYFADTKISLLTETFVNLFNVEHEVDISEKVWSKIINHHPFIVIGQPNILQRLKMLGFRTFEYDFIEPYDELPFTGDKRELKKKMSIIVENYRRWIETDFSNTLKQKVLADVSHNFVRLKSYYKEETNRIPFFRDFMWLRTFRDKFYPLDHY